MKTTTTCIFLGVLESSQLDFQFDDIISHYARHWYFSKREVFERISAVCYSDFTRATVIKQIHGLIKDK